MTDQETIAQLQRDNEALRKDNANIEELYQKLADYVDKLSGPDEHSVFETIDNTVARIETLKQNLAATEAKCERLKNEIHRLQRWDAAHYDNSEIDGLSLILSEPPSTSLANYIREQVEKEIREQTNEVKEALVKTVKWLVSYTDIVEENPLLDDIVSPALAKLKEIRGEK